MTIWIFKSEPDDYSFEELREAGEVRWDCIRNYGARNHLQRARPGDEVLFYHSGKRPQIVGIAEVASDPYPDPTQFDPDSDYYDAKSKQTAPRWWSVDIRYVRHLDAPIALAAIKAEPKLAEMELVRRQRLSVSEVTPAEYEVLLAIR